MAGVDWDAVLAEYRPLLDRISGASDFADLLWEVFGELATSHAYVVQAERRHQPAARRPRGAGRAARRRPRAGRRRPVAGDPRAAR